MFNRLTNPHFPRAAAGLRRESVSVVKLGQSGRGFALRQAATVELPEGVLRPSFAQSNIHEPDEVLSALREAVQSAGLKRQKRWSISLPADAARMSILTLEVQPKTKKELQDVLNWKAERAFGAKANEMRLAFQSLAADANSRPRYFSVAVRDNILAEYEDLFGALGWHVGLVLPRHVSEAQWLMLSKKTSNYGDSLLVSSQADGFTAILLRGQQPTIVRSVACEQEELEDELYRLLLYYRDRFAKENKELALRKFLVIGDEFAHDRLNGIVGETLGYDLPVLDATGVGLQLPADSIKFDDIAAAAGLASLAFR